MEAITITGLSKSFHGKYAVENLEMHVPDGAIYGFIGKNGAGKSTTQKMICGLLVPTAGTINLWGNPISDADTRARIGVLIEEPGVYMGCTARENLLLQAMNIGLERPESIVDQSLEMVGLENTGKKKVKQFSLGMRQRLGIASALLGSPDLLILDEPINGLDPEGIREIRKILLRLQEERHTTILISSHILGELSRIATHYGIIKDGRMVRELSAGELSGVCSDYIRIKTAQPESVLTYLRKHPAVERGEIVDGEIRLYGGADTETIGRCLMEHGDSVSEISVHRLDLEDYFMMLMGGERDA